MVSFYLLSATDGKPVKTSKVSQSVRVSRGASLACRESTYGLFVVNDGHNGATAARYVADMLSDYLHPLLPRGGPPPEKRGPDFTAWRHAIQRALTVAMALLHRSFAAKGVLAGCTSTVILQVFRRGCHHPARALTYPTEPLNSMCSLDGNSAQLLMQPHDL